MSSISKSFELRSGFFNYSANTRSFGKVDPEYDVRSYLAYGALFDVDYVQALEEDKEEDSSYTSAYSVVNQF